MVYMNKSFCSESHRCSARGCEHWIDDDHNTDEAIVLTNHMTDRCGFRPIAINEGADEQGQ
jgi:hypothetical protein